MPIGKGSARPDRGPAHLLRRLRAARKARGGEPEAAL